jgi:hypothetical protein
MFPLPARTPATRPAQAALERNLLACLGVDEDEAVSLAAAWGEDGGGGGGGGGGDPAPATPPPPLDRARHAAYLHAGLRALPRGFVSLAAGRPWIVYWIAHGLNLLSQPLAGADAAGERARENGGREG